MTREVEVTVSGDEVTIRKLVDTPEAREKVEAIRRAVEGFNKSDDDQPEAFRPGPGDEEDEDEDETETQAERRARLRQDRKMTENARESGRLAATRKDLSAFMSF